MCKVVTEHIFKEVAKGQNFKYGRRFQETIDTSNQKHTGVKLPGFVEV